MNTRLNETRQGPDAGRCAARIAATTLLMTVVLPTIASAQASQGRVGLEAQGGASIPTGNLGTLTDPGATFGLQAAYHLSPRVALNMDGNVDLLGGATSGSAGSRAPDMRLWRYGGGLSADLLPSPRWALVGSLGAGVARFSSDEFPDAGGSSTRFRHTYFTTNAGLKLGYNVSDRVTTFVGARGVLTRADEDDSRVLADLDPSRFEPFGSSWSVPVTAGVNVRLGGRQARAGESRPAPPAPRPAAVDDREQRETAARRLCEEAEAAMAAGDFARARSLLQRARAEYSGTLCANSVDAQLGRISAIETIQERIHFEYDRSRITDEAAQVLQRKAEVLRKYPDLRLVIEGHCDERGSLEYNQALGMRRAQATRQYLASMGISADMFDVVSFGEERPLTAESNERAWGLNRRSEFVIRNLGAIRAG